MQSLKVIQGAKQIKIIQYFLVQTVQAEMLKQNAKELIPGSLHPLYQLVLYRHISTRKTSTTIII